MVVFEGDRILRCFFFGYFGEMINGLEKNLEILLGKIASETWIPARFEPSTTTEVEPWALH